MSDHVTTEALHQQLLDDLVATLYCEPAEVDDDTTFQDLGLDSILGLEFLGLVNGRYQLSEEIDALYDHPTLAQLVQYLGGRLEQLQAERA
ncbi:acyl carrier protein [Streptomyces sp. PSAA01]|uniref:acyl carrier protein n=1 Tax=Streptomyces sp. PSAA01 TaxID=2912762 RepID=UPI001F46DA43|nr:acyl carrier protein [Streptomyces sp. PSAA01]MCG0286198.1 acyl carrier protein [Streptomyces sp. PSAA01]